MAWIRANVCTGIAGAVAGTGRIEINNAADDAGCVEDEVEGEERVDTATAADKEEEESDDSGDYYWGGNSSSGNGEEDDADHKGEQFKGRGVYVGADPCREALRRRWKATKYVAGGRLSLKQGLSGVLNRSRWSAPGERA